MTNDTPQPAPGLDEMRLISDIESAWQRVHGDIDDCHAVEKAIRAHERFLAALPSPATAGEGPSERFEHVAEAFCEATGMLAPGKDDASGSHSYEDRMEAWRIFTAGRKSASDIPLAAPPLQAVPPVFPNTTVGRHETEIDKVRALVEDKRLTDDEGMALAGVLHLAEREIDRMKNLGPLVIPPPVPPAEVEAAIRAFKDACVGRGAFGRTERIEAEMDRTGAALLALYRAVPATGGELVAWGVRERNGRGLANAAFRRRDLAEAYALSEAEVVPLYAAPVPPASADKRCDEKHPFGNCDCPPSAPAQETPK